MFSPIAGVHAQEHARNVLLKQLIYCRLKFFCSEITRELRPQYCYIVQLCFQLVSVKCNVMAREMPQWRI